MESFQRATLQTIAQSAVPLRQPKNADYSQLLEAIGDAEIVMIGEASHGTQDFYAHRAEISKHLIEKKGFNFIVAEADWPDAYRVNRYVRGGSKDKDAEEALSDFQRFPLWMWRNTPVRDFLDWLKSYNNNFDAQQDKCGFYGMDLYSFFRSMGEVVKYLENVNPSDAQKAKRAYANFDRFHGNEQAYGFSSAFGRSRSYEKEVVSILTDLHRKGPEYIRGRGGYINGEELFYATENAELVKDAEEYYRMTYVPGIQTWNLRDAHMEETVLHLRQHLGKGGKRPKGIIWAHNSHLGDARATEASKRGEWNVGQLLREKVGMEKTFSIGFSSFKGSVTAASQWDSPGKFMKVKNGLWDSWEHLFHSASELMKMEDYSLVLRSLSSSVEVNPSLVKALSAKRRIERYIGVIYARDTERPSHYQSGDLPHQFDALLYLDKSEALEPLDPPPKWLEKRKEYRADPDAFPELDEYSKRSSRVSIDLKDLLRGAKEISSIGDYFMEEGVYALAKEKYEKALEYALFDIRSLEKPEVEKMKVEVLEKMGNCDAKQNKWPQVIDTCNRILAEEESNQTALSLLSRAYHAKGRPDLVDSILKRVRR